MPNTTQVSDYYNGTMFQADLETAVEWSMNCFGEYEMVLYHDEETQIVNHPFAIIHSRTGIFTIISEN
tara:strand:- start:291 stop:494 length:204 start_codon:yes stop_codon:yes gene_type:complete